MPWAYPPEDREGGGQQFLIFFKYAIYSTLVTYLNLASPSNFNSSNTWLSGSNLHKGNRFVGNAFLLISRALVNTTKNPNSAPLLLIVYLAGISHRDSTKTFCSG